MEMLLDNVEIEKQIKKLDVLNRKPFVDQVFKVIELLARQKRNACFAINGVWGVGKSYTLDMLEKKLKEEQDGETASDKYAVFHYNCWQYDYYAEPIVAIVAAMLDVIEANDTILPKEYKAKIKGFLKVIGTGLLNKAGNIVEEYTGVDVNKFVNIISEGNEKAAEEIEKEHAFDYNFLFKKALERFRDMIKKISDEKTVVFIVDELDRCLPEYGIKVLERLHHMFEEIPNVQVILSIDKTQLEHIVKQTFGENTNTDKYLGKFINFEIDLDEGEMNEDAEERFNYYYSKFEQVVSNVTVEDVTEFKNILYKGVGIRSWINIIDKCQLLHSMLYPEDKKMDFSFLCIELFLTVAKYSGIDFGKDFSGYSIAEDFCDTKKGTEYKCFKGLGEKIRSLEKFNEMNYIYSDYNRKTVFVQDVFGVVLAAYRYISGHKNDIYSGGSIVREYKGFIKSFWELLNIIN